MGQLLYRLYGMYLAVLLARCAMEALRLGGDAASTVFGLARGRGPDSRQGYGWEQLVDGPLRPAPAQEPLQLLQGSLAGWPWERGFAEALVRWASALQWVPGLGQVTYPELALDFESHSNRALPAKPGHRGRACCGRRSTCCSSCSPAIPCRREISGGCAPLWCPLGLSQHGANTAAGVCVPARHAAAHAAASAALPGAVDPLAVDPGGWPQGLFLDGVLAALPRHHLRRMQQYSAERWGLQ